MVATHLIGVRGAQFALQFPHQIREFAARGDPRQQRQVALQHGRPVDARHVLDPEVVALQPPHLMQHLRPLLRRLHRQAHAGEVDDAALARGLAVARLGLVVGRPRGVDGAQLLAAAHQQRVPVSGEREAVGLRDQGLGLGGGEIEDLQVPRRVLVAAAAVRARDRQRRPHDLAARHAGDLAEAAFGHREGRDASRQAFGLDRRQRAGGGTAILVIDVPGTFFHALGRRLERRRPTGLQRNQVGPRSARKAQLELHAVVDRVVGAQRQEVEVGALGVEGRRVVAELGLRGQHGAGGARRRDLAQLDRRVSRTGGERIGHPAAAGRPDRVLDAPVFAVIGQHEAAGVDIAHPQLVAVVGDGHPAALRRSAQRGDVAQVPGQLAHGVGTVNLDAFFAAGVAGRHQGLPIGQPLAQAAARPRHAMPLHGAFPQRHREDLAARFERQAVAVGMELHALQVIGRRDEAARRLRACARHLDVEPFAALTAPG